MSSRDGKRRRILSYEERVLWTAVTQSVSPLRGKAHDAEPEDEAPAAPAPPPRAKHHGKAAAPPRPAARAVPPPPPPPSLEPLGRRLKQRVARGKEKIEGRLDLHGYTQAEAHDALLRFVRSANARDARLVLVITGKSGVLRRQVPLWLGLPELRSLVVGFEDSHISHGGEGALYVRVRRAGAR